MLKIMMMTGTECRFELVLKLMILLCMYIMTFLASIRGAADSNANGKKYTTTLSDGNLGTKMVPLYATLSPHFTKTSSYHWNPV